MIISRFVKYSWNISFYHMWKNSGKRGSTRDLSSKEKKDYFAKIDTIFRGNASRVDARTNFGGGDVATTLDRAWKLNIEGNSRTTATWGEVKVALGRQSWKSFVNRDAFARRNGQKEGGERRENRDANVALLVCTTYSLCSYPPTYLCVFSVSTRVHKPCRPPPSPSTHKPSPRFFHPTHRHRDSSPPLRACVLFPLSCNEKC